MSALVRLLERNSFRSSFRYFSTTGISASGHSKWDTIKHKKAANDAARARVSFKMSSKITVLAKMGGSDLTKNLQLAYAIEKAKALSIPKRVIENAVKRGTGEMKSSAKMETVTYEGLGPGGVAVVIEAITDNKNRTIGMIRPCFNKYGSNMTPTAYMFDRKGILIIDLKDADFDEEFDNMIELGCDDINQVSNENNENLVELVTDPKELGKVANQIKEDNKYTIKEMEFGYIPKDDMKVEISNPETKESFESFVQLLEDLDDVEKVYTNVEN